MATSGLLQGAEDYLRHLAHRPGVSTAVAAHLQNVLADWDKRVGAGRLQAHPAPGGR